MSNQGAQQLLEIRSALICGRPVTYQDLELYSAGRVFGLRDGSYHCSCGAFPEYRRCLHTLGHALMTGAESMPAQHDETRLQTSKRPHGRPQKAGDRYTKPAEDDVDINTMQAEVQELEALLSKQALPPKKTRRIMRKSSGA